jgi:hypothetical protein
MLPALNYDYYNDDYSTYYGLQKMRRRSSMGPTFKRHHPEHRTQSSEFRPFEVGTTIVHEAHGWRRMPASALQI